MSSNEAIDAAPAQAAPVRARVRDDHVTGTRPLPTPLDLSRDIPVTDDVSELVLEGRSILRGLLDGSDPRTLVIVGPCSVDDPEAAVEYARRLRDISR